MAERKRLPPLKALQAFTSAAHHLNFSRAAEELCVTAAAVSHQIRLLERTLNTVLFERLPRGLRLTPAGLSLQSVTDRAFAEIGEVIDAIRADDTNETVHLASLPHFSGKVMFPLRRQFMDSHPRFDIEISHTLTVPEFGDGSSDFAVLFGKGDWPGLECELLFLSPVGPACAPSLISAKGFGGPADIAAYPILLDHSCFRQIWIDWFGLTRSEGWERLNYVPCNDIHALLGAARQGYGFIMEPEFMIGDLLAAGKLIYPVQLRLMNYGYYLVYPKQALHKASSRAFRDWMLSRAEGFRLTAELEELSAAI
ncbi:LysR family glycine cleavage system transcriptional activator [Rhodoligotrophos appendicifer]|uniref:LysR substrate-binding domain-containing protein n=1 Tax=Rhodoligotrophos appendicifer TaxID=987056 RepID=UPI0011847CB0|nr:LysR substrate-binding domain-containing protein [Rhodoligotrophos appendicifer]